MIKTYTIKEGQKLTEEQLREIEEAKKKPIVFDEECEELSPEMMKAFRSAAGHRNRRKNCNVWREKSMEYTVNISWDEDANVWIAESSDIPGLVLESDSYDVLIERLKTAVPEMIDDNKLPKMSFLNCVSERHLKFD